MIRKYVTLLNLTSSDGYKNNNMRVVNSIGSAKDDRDIVCCPEDTDPILITNGVIGVRWAVAELLLRSSQGPGGFVRNVPCSV